MVYPNIIGSNVSIECNEQWNECAYSSRGECAEKSNKSKQRRTDTTLIVALRCCVFSAGNYRVGMMLSVLLPSILSKLRRACTSPNQKTDLTAQSIRSFKMSGSNQWKKSALDQTAFMLWYSKLMSCWLLCHFRTSFHQRPWKLPMIFQQLRLQGSRWKTSSPIYHHSKRHQSTASSDI